MKAQHFTSDYGRPPITVSETCPTTAISHRLGNVHVGALAAAVEGLIRCHVADMRRQGQRGWTAEREGEAVRFALWQHEENGAEYRHATGGLS